MIDGYTFYHGTLRKTVVAFGSLFNNIRIQRRETDGTLVQTLKIPLSYGPKQKFLTRIRQNPEFNERIELTVPRIGFEITNMQRDTSRQIAPTHKRPYLVSDTRMNTQFTPTTWNIEFGLYILVKNQDDGLQIVEQILPFFTPDYNLTVNDIPDMGIKHELAITLNSVSHADDWEGNYDTRTAIVWTLNFQTKVNIYGPVYKQGAIKHVIATAYPNMPGQVYEGEQYTADVDPESAEPTDEYTILEAWDQL